MRKELLATVFSDALLDNVCCSNEPATAHDNVDAVLMHYFPEMSDDQCTAIADVLYNAIQTIYHIAEQTSPDALVDDAYTAAYDYDEEATLQRLADNMSELVDWQNDMFDAGLMDDVSTFKILINGQPHEFISGGPQIAALYDFIEHICSENDCNVIYN